jgi:hypothetical protein
MQVMNAAGASFLHGRRGAVAAADRLGDEARRPRAEEIEGREDEVEDGSGGDDRGAPPHGLVVEAFSTLGVGHALKLV